MEILAERNAPSLTNRNAGLNVIRIFYILTDLNSLPHPVISYKHPSIYSHNHSTSINYN